MSVEPVLATLRLTTSSGPLAFDTSIPLRQRRGRSVGHLTGARADVLLQATVRARRDGNMIAVVEAARGRYYLVPLRMDGSTGNPTIAGFSELVDVPGMQTLSLWPETKGLVAIVDQRQYVTSDGRRSVVARG